MVRLVSLGLTREDNGQAAWTGKSKQKSRAALVDRRRGSLRDRRQGCATTSDR
jgi:hypothetical protein